MIQLPNSLFEFVYKPVSSDDGVSSAVSDPLLEEGSDEKAIFNPGRQMPTWPWMVSTLFLALALLVILILDYPLYSRESFETGFATEMQAGIHVIELEERKFWGGIRVAENGSFYQNFDPDEKVRFVGTPSRELDAAWDRLTGTFVSLTKEEAESVRGEMTEYKGGFLASTAAQHHIHCLNFIRQCLYDDYYPEVHVPRENIPNYYLHIDHCIDTLRQMLQCSADMTPVPKAWEPIKGIYLANTEMVHTCRKYEPLVEWNEMRFEQTQ